VSQSCQGLSVVSIDEWSELKLYLADGAEVQKLLSFLGLPILNIIYIFLHV